MVRHERTGSQSTRYLVVIGDGDGPQTPVSCRGQHGFHRAGGVL